MEDTNRPDGYPEENGAIRIVRLPPMTVASSHSTGDHQEEIVGAAISAFIKESGLIRSKPDLRRLGFNNPAGDQPGGSLGYEAWVSIPDGMDVPAPLVKKRFQGGLYAACAIAFGEFQEWGRLWEWAMNHPQYQVDFCPRTDPADPGADPSLEEQLDPLLHLEDTDPFATRLDLLLPIRPRQEREAGGN